MSDDVNDDVNTNAFDVQPIAASHLFRVRCSACGERSALAAPGQETRARCTECLGGSQSVPAGSMPYTVPTGYSLTFGRGSVPLNPRTPYPEPEITSRDADGGAASANAEGASVNAKAFTFPGPVLVLAAEADVLGWGVVTARARGCSPHATTGRPGAVRDSFSVRFAAGTWQGYAIYVGSAWESIMVTGASLPPFGKMGRTELGVWLADPDQPDSWYDAIRARRTAQALAAKQRARTAPRKGNAEEAS